MSPNGRLLYVLVRESKGILTFKIGENGGLEYVRCLSNNGRRGCKSVGKRLYAPINLVQSPVGNGLYVNVGGETLERYDVRRKGVLHFRGCLSIVVGKDCQYENRLDEVSLNAISPDGKNLYLKTDLGWWIYGVSR